MLNKAKNETIREVTDKLEQIEKAAGKEGIRLTEKELDEEFDPKKYAQMENAVFGDDYYKQKEPETSEFVQEKEKETVPEPAPAAEANAPDQELIPQEQPEEEEPAEAEEGGEEEWWFCDGNNALTNGHSVQEADKAGRDQVRLHLVRELHYLPQVLQDCSAPP